MDQIQQKKEHRASLFAMLNQEIDRIASLLASRGLESTEGMVWNRFTSACVVAELTIADVGMVNKLNNAYASWFSCKSELKAHRISEAEMRPLEQALDNLISKASPRDEVSASLSLRGGSGF
jgi:hypothetical protein